MIFREIKAHRHIQYVCRCCHKHRCKRLSDFQTINPYNKTADGSVKTAEQISEELEKELDKQEREFDKVCKTCKDLQRPAKEAGL